MSLIEAALEKARQAQEQNHADEQKRLEKMRNAARQKEILAVVEETDLPEKPAKPLGVGEIEPRHFQETFPAQTGAKRRELEIPRVIFYGAVPLAVGFAFYFCWLFLRPEKPAPVEVKALSNIAVVRAEAVAARPAIKKEDGTKPTPRIAAAHPSANYKFTLTGITTSGLDRFALINDKVLALGDQLGEATVMYIGQTSVVLRVRGQDVELTLS